MEPNNNLPVPLIRDCIRKEMGETSSFLGAAVAAVLVIVLFFIFGFFLFWIFSSKIMFLVTLGIGVVLGVGVYSIARKYSNKLAPGLQDRILFLYQPWISKLNSAGFEAAAEHAKAIIKLGSVMTQTQPHVFAVIDEALRFFLTRFFAVIQAKNLLGDSSDLKRQISRLQQSVDSHLQQTQSGKATSVSERQSLDAQISSLQSRLDKIEKVNRSALQITNELSALRNDCENTVLEKLIGEEENRKSTLLLKEQLDRERRVMAEMQSLGL